MLVSLHWLSQYVSLTGLAHADLTDRLMMAGLNHESTTAADGGDFCVDLEVTSNRPDCLGQIGVAREISVEAVNLDEFAAKNPLLTRSTSSPMTYRASA